MSCLYNMPLSNTMVEIPCPADTRWLDPISAARGLRRRFAHALPVGKENITCYDAVSRRAGPLLSIPAFCHNAVVSQPQSAPAGLSYALRCYVCSTAPGLRQDTRHQSCLVSITPAPALRRI